MLVPVILAGGSGNRLWPLSRQSLPKQLISFVDDQSLLQATLTRLNSIQKTVAIQPPLIILNEQNYFQTADQLENLHRDKYLMILEPCRRNTAPAIAIAAMHILKLYPENPYLLVMPADHAISQNEQFAAKIQTVLTEMTKEQLLSFGVKPTSPKTGYGYIRRGAEQSESIFSVQQFVEKPNLENAKRYLQSGDYCWNSGIFIFSAQAYLDELVKYSPEVFAACEIAYQHIHHAQDYCRLDKHYENCPDISIDYAVMEKTKNAVCSELSTNWSDVGDWAALAELLPKDSEGNVVRGEVVYENSKNCYLHSEARLLAAVGVQDLIAVETVDAVLIAHKDCTQDVRKIVSTLQQQKSEKAIHHRKIHRPWGWYEQLAIGEHFQVKHLVIKVGGKISLQKHQHRAEHWVVVDGLAEVIRNEEKFTLTRNESTHIPAGTLHRLSNLGETPLHVIEVQSGAYLGEDDITRFSDVYGREICEEI